MKKIINIMLVILVLVLFYLTKDISILPLVISFSLYILYMGIFSEIDISKIKKEKGRDKIYYKLIFLSIIISIILIFISYVIGSILNIDKLNIINIFMVLSLEARIVLMLTKEYLEILGYNKLGSKILDIYDITVIGLDIILSVILYMFVKLNNYINIILLYSVGTIISILFMLFLYFFFFKKRNSKDKVSFRNTLKVISYDKNKILVNIFTRGCLYITIIILYYIVANRYYYTYKSTSTLIVDTYFYGLFIIYIIYKLIIKKININYDVKDDNFNKNINKILMISLSTAILLSVISSPLSNLLFGRDYNILFNLVLLLFFYILYNYIINLSLLYLKDKNILVILITGFIISILSEIPLISAVYRMGFPLVLGSILSLILGIAISIIMGIIFIKNKFKINLLSNFNNILNIIYENIIYCLIMVLFTLVVKIDTNNIIDSILVIIFYALVTTIYYFIRRVLYKLR